MNVRIDGPGSNETILLANLFENLKVNLSVVIQYFRGSNSYALYFSLPPNRSSSAIRINCNDFRYRNVVSLYKESMGYLPVIKKVLWDDHNNNLPHNDILKYLKQNIPRARFLSYI